MGQRHTAEEMESSRQRAKKVREKLPISIIPFFVTKYPDFDNSKDRKRVSNVLNGVIADEDIMSKLESIAEYASK